MVRVADLVVTYCQFELRAGEGLPAHYEHYGEHTYWKCVFSVCICVLVSLCLCKGPCVFVYTIHMMLFAHLCVCVYVLCYRGIQGQHVEGKGG